MATGTFQKSHKEEELLEHKEVSFFTASCISVCLCVYGVILQNAALTVETSQEAGSHITETQLFQAVNTEMWVFVGLHNRGSTLTGSRTSCAWNYLERVITAPPSQGALLGETGEHLAGHGKHLLLFTVSLLQSPPDVFGISNMALK